MKVETIQDLDSRGLRRFGIMTGAIIGLLFGVLLPWIWEFGYPLWPWIVMSVLLLLAIAHPPWLRPIYRGWMKFGLLISRVTTPVILGIVFFLIFVPVGLVFKIFSRDPMDRKFDAELDTYRIDNADQRGGSLENPY